MWWLSAVPSRKEYFLMCEVHYLCLNILSLFKDVGIWDNILVKAKCKISRNKFDLGSNGVEK